jgi:hypothetical protein
MKRRDFDWTNPSWENLFIAIPWGIGVLAAVFAWTADHNIAQREQTTMGVITDHKAGRSDRYQYSFSVNGTNSRDRAEVMTVMKSETKLRSFTTLWTQIPTR